MTQHGRKQYTAGVCEEEPEQGSSVCPFELTEDQNSVGSVSRPNAQNVTNSPADSRLLPCGNINDGDHVIQAGLDHITDSAGQHVPSIFRDVISKYLSFLLMR